MTTPSWRSMTLKVPPSLVGARAPPSGALVPKGEAQGTLLGQDPDRAGNALDDDLEVRPGWA